MTTPPTNKKNSFSGILFPIIILVLVISATGTLYYYNNEIEKENNKLAKDIKEVDNKIKEIKKDESLRIYDLLTKNKKTIDKLNSYSQIPRFIKGFDYIKNKYKISLEGFNYSNGSINTIGTSNFINSSTASYITTSNFIKKYRADENVDFKLPFINKINSTGIPGKRNMKFNIKLQVKDNIFKEKINK